MKQTTFGRLPVGAKFRLVVQAGSQKLTTAQLPPSKWDTIDKTYIYTKVKPYLNREYFLCNAKHDFNGAGFLPDYALVKVWEDVELSNDTFPIIPSESFIIY